MADNSRVVEPCFFPTLTPESAPKNTSQTSQGRKSITTPLDGLDAKLIESWLGCESVELLTLVQVAWAIVLRSYATSDLPCFGSVDLEDGNPRIGIFTYPISGSTPVREALRHQQSSEIDPNSQDVQSMCKTLLYVDGDDRKGSIEQLDQFGIIVRVRKDRRFGALSTELDYMPTLLSDEHAQSVAQSMNRAILEVIRHTDRTVGFLDICSDADIQRVLRWNQTSNDQPHLKECAHEVILQQCLNHPESIAVSAWDGELTYGGLHQLASTFAIQLADLGVGPGVFVPLFFEKSKWTVVAVLAVIKAGGAFVLIDVSHPPNRVRTICQAVSANIAVSSVQHRLLAQQVVDRVAVLDGECGKAVDSPLTSVPAPQKPSPDDMLYAIFTSGSTGEPKGVAVDNASFCSISATVCRAYSFSPETRVLQFASHAFTICTREILMVLMTGGRLCIPSEMDRINDLSGFINRQRANFAILTPSVVGTLTPASVPTLQTLILGGEPASPGLISTWANKMHLAIGYGASEIAGTGVLSPRLQQNHDPRNLGLPCGASLWIVDVDNPDRLAPFGAVGELIMQSHGLARHYINDEKRTRQQFLDQAEWQNRLPTGQGAIQGARLYRTGDLFRYKLDGSVQCMGRKDNQVKVHGQRIELGEIESQITANLPSIEKAVVELVRLEKQNNRPLLMAFVCPAPTADWGEAKSDDALQPLHSPTEQFHLDIESLSSKLRESLPSYMVPSVFIPLSAIPLTLTGKANRRLLRETVSTWSEDMLATYHSARRSRVQSTGPLTGKDQRIQRLVATALKRDINTVSMNSNFFLLGGDSITAMRLVTLAKQDGLRLTVREIFDNPILSELVAFAQEGSVEAARAQKAAVQIADIDEGLRRQLPADISDNIVQVLPTTDFQKFTLTELPPLYLQIALPKNVDRTRLLDACQHLLERHEILRTVFAINKGEMVQLVLRPYQVRFVEHNGIENLDQHCVDDTNASPLPTEANHEFQVHLVTMQDSSLFLVLRFIHAQYDGLSVTVFSEDLSAAYNRQPLAPTAPYSDHLQATLASRTVEGLETWRRVLHGSEMTLLNPNQFSQTTQRGKLVTAIKHTPLVSPPENFTMATLIKVSWALALERFLSARHPTTLCADTAKDIVFAQIVHGRGLGIPHEERILGPCASTIPVRVRIAPTDTKFDLLHQTQQQHLETMPFHNIGPGDIIRNCTSWPLSTKLATIIRFKNFETDLACSFDGVAYPGKVFHLPDLPSDKFRLFIEPSEADMRLTFTGFDHVLPQQDAEDLVDHFCSALEFMSQGPVEDLVYA